MALVFAVVFAGLGFGVSVLYRQFLSVDSDMDGHAGSGEGSDGKPVSGDKKGQSVDIVIRDEDLPSDEVTGQYIVTSGRNLLTKEDVRTVSASPAQAQNAYSKVDAVKAANKTAAENTAKASQPSSDGGFSSSGNADTDGKFVPVRNLETLYNVSGKESVTPDSSGISSPSKERTFTAEDEELDTLPSMEDMGNLGSDESGSSYNDSGINNDSDFATSGISSKKTADETVIQDAPLMAKAISTILSNES